MSFDSPVRNNLESHGRSRCGGVVKIVVGSPAWFGSQSRTADCFLQVQDHGEQVGIACKRLEKLRVNCRLGFAATPHIDLSD